METDILTPVDVMHGHLTQEDRAILLADRDCLAELVAAILENRRLAAMVVHAWLGRNNYLLLPKDQA